MTLYDTAELSEDCTAAVGTAGNDKTAWLVDTIRQILNQSEKNSDARMMVLVKK